MLGAVAWCSTTRACWSFVYRPRKRELGWPEPIVLLSRGRLLNSRDPDRVRAPDHRQKPGSGPSDPSNGPNGSYRVGGPAPVAPNKLGAWGCGLVFHHERLLEFCLSTEEKRVRLGLGRTEPIVLLSRGPSLEFSGPGGGQSTRRPAKARKQAV